jgi:hypothetical protein
MKRRLPLGIQTFEIIRSDGFVYVGKTARIRIGSWKLGRMEARLNETPCPLF